MDPFLVLGSHTTSILPNRDPGSRRFCGSNISNAISIPLYPDQAKEKENMNGAIIKTRTGFFPSGKPHWSRRRLALIAGFRAGREAV
jgi:hypothetical protein